MPLSTKCQQIGKHTHTHIYIYGSDNLQPRTLDFPQPRLSHRQEAFLPKSSHENTFVAGRCALLCPVLAVPDCDLTEQVENKKINTHRPKSGPTLPATIVAAKLQAVPTPPMSAPAATFLKATPRQIWPNSLELGLRSAPRGIVTVQGPSCQRNHDWRVKCCLARLSTWTSQVPKSKPETLLYCGITAVFWTLWRRRCRFGC